METKTVLKIFKKNGGIMRLSQARDLGIQTRDLSRLVTEGKLLKEELGIYTLSDLNLNEKSELALVSLKSSEAVICLISALAFHDLTTQIPNHIDIALPQKRTRKPKFKKIKCEIYVIGGKAYLSGIEVHKIHGIDVKIYSKEKTVVDCFKFRNKIGLDVALEALDAWAKQRGRNISELMRFARICRVANILKPYLEVKLG